MFKSGPLLIVKSFCDRFRKWKRIKNHVSNFSISGSSQKEPNKIKNEKIQIDLGYELSKTALQLIYSSFIGLPLSRGGGGGRGGGEGNSHIKRTGVFVVPYRFLKGGLGAS